MGEALRSEFASEGAPGFAMSVGDMTGPGVAEDLASQVEWPVFLIPAEPDGARCQASAWFAGTIRLPQVSGGLVACLAGAVIR